MKMIKYIFILFYFISLSTIESCSYFTKKVESLSTTTVNNTDEIKNQKLNCQKKALQISLVNDSNLNSHEDYFNKKSFLNKSFIDKSLILALLELTRRPDAISPNSRWQVFIKYNKKEYYFDFRPKQMTEMNNFPLIYGLEYISNLFNSSKLDQLISEIDYNSTSNVPVDIQLENFLATYKKEIDKNESLKNYFFKGDELITHFESFKKNSLSTLFQYYKKNKLNNSNLYESDKNLLKEKYNESNFQIACNFDFKKELDNSADSNTTKDDRSLSFGIKENDNFFIAIASSTLIHPFSTYGSSYVIKMLPSALPVPSCYMTSNLINGLFLSSLDGKSKSQHLKHLIDYDIYNSKNLNEVRDILKFSRHLFLSNPDRILYESKRGRKDQIDFFLTMNFPIYHVEQLGNIIGFASFKNENSLILDDRTKAEIWCTE